MKKSSMDKWEERLGLFMTIFARLVAIFFVAWSIAQL
jgi:hypothetical protein